MEEEKMICDWFGKEKKTIVLRCGAEKDLQGEDRARVHAALVAMSEGAFQMPAFGVSIDRLTRGEMKKGVWLRLVYEREEECAGLPFCELAFEVRPEYCGFNLCRLYRGKYEGRCFYLDLRDHTMGGLFQVLIEIVGE